MSKQVADGLGFWVTGGWWPDQGAIVVPGMPVMVNVRVGSVLSLLWSATVDHSGKLVAARTALGASGGFVIRLKTAQVPLRCGQVLDGVTAFHPSSAHASPNRPPLICNRKTACHPPCHPPKPPPSCKA